MPAEISRSLGESAALWYNPRIVITSESRTMKLTVTVEDRTQTLDVPEAIIEQGESFFQKMDSDMDRGWQMGPEFIENPDRLNRCQIAADKMLIAIDTQNENLLMLMAGYILSRMPGVTKVVIDTHGEMLGTELIMGQGKTAH